MTYDVWLLVAMLIGPAGETSTLVRQFETSEKCAAISAEMREAVLVDCFPVPLRAPEPRD